MEHTCVGEDDDVTHTHLFINTYIHTHTYTYQHQLFSKIQVDILVAERHYKTLFLDATLSCEPLLYHTTEDTAILTSPWINIGPSVTDARLENKFTIHKDGPSPTLRT